MRPALLGLLLGAGGCGTGDTCDTAVDVCTSVDNTEAYDGDLEISEVRWACCDAASNPECDSSWFWYDVITDGIPSRTTLIIAETDKVADSKRWVEMHEMPSADSDPDGYWDDRYLELAVADTSSCSSLRDCEDQYQAGVATLFPCSETWTVDNMAWAVRVYEANSATTAHCVAWGAETPLGCEAWDVEP